MRLIEALSRSNRCLFFLCLTNKRHFGFLQSTACYFKEVFVCRMTYLFHSFFVSTKTKQTTFLKDLNMMKF